MRLPGCAHLGSDHAQLLLFPQLLLSTHFGGPDRPKSGSKEGKKKMLENQTMENSGK